MGSGWAKLRDGAQERDTEMKMTLSDVDNVMNRTGKGHRHEEVTRAKDKDAHMRV